MVLPGVRLDPLKTLVEVDTREELSTYLPYPSFRDGQILTQLVEVQVVEIPVRLANKATRSPSPGVL